MRTSSHPMPATSLVPAGCSSFRTAFLVESVLKLRSRVCPIPGRHCALSVLRRLALLEGGPATYCAGWEVGQLSDFFKVVAAGPMFFVSAWVLMIFAGIVYKDVGIVPFGYVSSMVVTIGLWLTMAPAIGAVARVSGPRRK